VFDVVTHPQCGKALAGDAEFDDELDKFAIWRLAPRKASKKRDHPSSEPLPVTVKNAQSDSRMTARKMVCPVRRA